MTTGPGRHAGALRRAGAALAFVALGAGGVAAKELNAHSNYILRCAGCHGVEGAGSPSAGIPPFPGFVSALLSDDDGRTYVTHVPGVVGSSLTNAEIAAVLNYVNDAWSGSAPAAPFTEEEVRRRRAALVPDIVAYRRAIVARLSEKGVRLADYPWP